MGGARHFSLRMVRGTARAESSDVDSRRGPVVDDGVGDVPVVIGAESAVAVLKFRTPVEKGERNDQSDDTSKPFPQRSRGRRRCHSVHASRRGASRDTDARTRRPATGDRERRRMATSVRELGRQGPLLSAAARRLGCGRYAAHAAVAIERTNTSQAPLYGVIWIGCRTEVDKETRRVTFLDLTIEKASFPSELANAARYLAALQAVVPARTRIIALDRLEAALAEKTVDSVASGRTLKNDPPRIIFAETPTLHVPIDGTAVLRPAGEAGLDRVINTRQLILFDKAQSRYYLRLYDGWMTAAALEGPWEVAADAPKTLDKAMNVVLKTMQVDLLDGTSPENSGEEKPTAPPSLAKDPGPAIHVSTSPTEVIVTRRAELRADRRHPAPLRREHDVERLQVARGPERLRPALRPLVQVGERAGALDVRARTAAPGRFHGHS